MFVYYRPCSVLFVIRHWIAVYAVSVNFFIPVINGEEVKSVQCDDFMLDSGNSSCDPEIVSGDDVICNFTCNDGYNLTDIDTRMCQDGNLTVNATLCMRNSSDDDISKKIIAGGVSLFVILVICIVIVTVIVCCCCCRRKKATVSISTNPENGHNDDTDIPHEGDSAENDGATYYNTNTTTSVKIQSNPSYNVNVHAGIECSSEQYVYPDNPRDNIADDIYDDIPENSNAADDIYDDVSSVHEYLAVTK